jgi:hypothetical protein
LKYKYNYNLNKNKIFLLKYLQGIGGSVKFVSKQMTKASRSFKEKTLLGGEIFWQTHLLVAVAEIMENPKRANHSVEVRILPQQQFEF